MNNPKPSPKQLLSIYYAHLHCLKDLYHPITNPQGFVSFGFAKNCAAIDKTLNYLPSYLCSNDCGYAPFRATTAINEIIAKTSVYKVEQTIVINSLVSVLDILSYKKKISIQGQFKGIQNIIDHAGAELTLFGQSDLHIVVADCQPTIQKWSDFSGKDILIVVKDQKEVIYSKLDNVLYAYQIYFQQGYKCGVLQTSNKQRLIDLERLYCFHGLSTLIQASIVAQSKNSQLTHNINQQWTKQQIIHDQFNLYPYKNMMQLDSGYIPNENNLYFCIGSTGCLNNWAYSLFKKGDILGVDAPYYFFLSGDFQKSGFTLSFSSIFQGTLLSRIQRSQAFGQRGYVVVNPHNPTGKVISPEEIIAVCEWAQSHPHYHVLFNQVYLNSVHNPSTKIISCIEYADKFENVHVIRGFSKDYGICGFRVGFMISCNPIIKQKFTLWKEVITPQQFVLQIISKMLLKSNFGQQIYAVSKKGLLQSTELAIKILQQYQIPYIRPEGAVFLMINLHEYLKTSQQTEQSLWCKIFYEYKVNISRGTLFNATQKGYYRLAHITHEDNIREGLRRLGNLINKQGPFDI